MVASWQSQKRGCSARLFIFVKKKILFLSKYTKAVRRTAVLQW